MSQPNQPPVRLVQIEPRRPAPSAVENKTEQLQIPQLSEWEIYKHKAYIGYRKIIGFLYTDHSYGATRRWVLSHILPDKILYRWQPYKRGECNRCGLCCKIVFTCPFYHEGETTSACAIYTSPKHAPTPCVTFPFDPIDLREVQKQVAPAPCPFYFEGQPEHPTTWGAVKAELKAEWEKKVDKLKEAFDF